MDHPRCPVSWAFERLTFGLMLGFEKQPKKVKGCQLDRLVMDLGVEV